MLRNFFIILFFLFSSSLKAKLSSSEIAQATALVKKTLASHNRGHIVFFKEAPISFSEDFSKKESRQYLYYFRALGFFFESRFFKSKNNIKKERESLEKAKADLERAYFSPYGGHKGKIEFWQDKIQLDLIDLAKKEGNSKEVSRLTRERPSLKKEKSEQISYLSDSDALRKTKEIIAVTSKFFHEGKMSQDFSSLTRLYPKIKTKDKRTNLEEAFLSQMESSFHLFSPDDFDKIASKLWHKDKHSFALFIIEHGLQVYKYNSIFPKLLFKKAKIYQEMKSYKESEEILKKIVEVASGTKDHEKALYELAFNRHFFMKKNAKKEFEDYLKLYPKGDYETVSLYSILRYEIKSSRGELSKKVKDKLEAFFKKNPMSYYSFLLGRDYKEIYNLVLKEFLLSKNDAGKKDLSSLNLPPLFQGYRTCFLELKEFGLNDESISLLRKMRSEEQSYESELFLLNAFREAGLLNEVVTQAIRLFGRYPESQNAETLKETLPLFAKDFLDKTLKSENKKNLNSFLVMSLVRQESAFNEDVVSPAGAIGLMQMLPSTAKQIAKKTGKKNFSLRKKEDNLFFGTNYLKSLLNQFNNNQVYALGAYNAGPHSMATWLKWGKELDPEEFIERIPYKETSLYVKLIMRNFIAYQLLYGEPQIEKAQFFF